MKINCSTAIHHSHTSFGTIKKLHYNLTKTVQTRGVVVMKLIHIGVVVGMIRGVIHPITELVEV